MGNQQLMLKWVNQEPRWKYIINNKASNTRRNSKSVKKQKHMPCRG